MSREIKFRVWDSVKNEMISNDLICKLGLFGLAFIPSSDTKPMQYTGIKDKNGVEIYEGDIVRFQSNWDDHIGVVEFEDCAFFVGRELKGNIGVSWGSPLVDFMSGSGCDGYTVIGNIYENPELLEIK